MKIVLLESLGVPEEVLKECAAPLAAAGHSFTAYPKDTDPAVQIERAKDADVIMIANMPLSGQVIEACTNLKFIDVAFTGVDHVDLNAARAKGVKVSNAAGYSTQAVAELTVCMSFSLLRNVPQVEARCRAGQTKDGLVGLANLAERPSASWAQELSACVWQSCAGRSAAKCWPINAM